MLLYDEATGFTDMSRVRVAVNFGPGVDDNICRKRVRKAAAFTSGGDPNKIKLETIADWRKWLTSGHSPIRRIPIDVEIYNYPFFVHPHYRAHGKFQEHYVLSSRVDHAGRPPKREAYQPVNHLIDTNPTALRDMMFERLCTGSGPSWETHYIALLIKYCMQESDNILLQAIADTLLPSCGYLKMCKEPWNKHKPLCGNHSTKLTATSIIAQVRALAEFQTGISGQLLRLDPDLSVGLIRGVVDN